MKIERLVADVTAVGSLDKAELTSHIIGRGATLWCRNPLLSADNFTQGHLMKMKLLVTAVTAIGTPGRAVRAVFGGILAGRVFGRFRSFLWSGSHFVV